MLKIALSLLLVTALSGCAFQMSIVIGEASIGCDWVDGYPVSAEGNQCIAGAQMSEQTANTVSEIGTSVTPQGALGGAVEELVR